MLQMTHIQKIYRTELVRTHALRELMIDGRVAAEECTHSQADIPQAVCLNGGEPLAACI